MSIANYENMLSSALKRAIRLKRAPVACPRISDLDACVASTTRQDRAGDGGRRERGEDPRQAGAEGGAERLQPHFSASDFDDLVRAFQSGLKVDVSDMMPVGVRASGGEARPLHAASKLGAKDPAAVASAVEFVLEGLHLSRKLNKDSEGRPDQLPQLVRLPYWRVWTITAIDKTATTARITSISGRPAMVSRRGIS